MKHAYFTRIALLFLATSLTFYSCEEASTDLKDPSEEVEPDKGEPDKEEEDKEEEDKGEFIYESWDNDFAPTPEDAANPTKNIVKDYGAANDGKTDISAILQNAIDEVSENGGGVIYMPEGEYTFSFIEMRSDVKLYIDHRAVIHPFYKESSRTYLFSFGDSDTKAIKNTEIRGIGGRFKIILQKKDDRKAIRVFHFKAVKDFAVANVHIEDVRTELPIMAFGPTEQVCMFEGKDLLGPTNGHISYASANNCHYGYGLVQMQCIVDCTFEYLSGVGGVTLRAETGYKDMNLRQRGGVFGLVGKNLYCKDGNAVAMASPHAMHGGTVYFENIVSDGSGWACRVDEGYTTKDQAAAGLTPGTYESVVVKGVMARYGTNAQVKTKHHKYMPADLAAISKANQTVIPEGEETDKGNNEAICEPSPAVAAVLHITNYPSEVTDVKAFGFRTPDIMTGIYGE